MLMAMMIGTLAANAQSARRGDAQKRTTTTSKSYNKPSNKSKSTAARQTAQARKPQAKVQNVQRKQTQRGQIAYNRKPANTNRNSYTQTRTSTQKANVQRQAQKPKANMQRQTQKPKANMQRQYQKPVSTTTMRNPKSDYGKANKTVRTGKTLVDPKRGSGYDNKGNHNSKVSRNKNTVTHYSKTGKAHQGHY